MPEAAHSIAKEKINLYTTLFQVIAQWERQTKAILYVNKRRSSPIHILSPINMRNKMFPTEK